MFECSEKIKSGINQKWQFSTGIGGSFQPDWVASFTGMGGRFGAEYTLKQAGCNKVFQDTASGAKTN